MTLDRLQQYIADMATDERAAFLARAADERAAFLARRQLFEDQAKQLADECDHAAKAEPDEGLEYGPPPPGYTAEELERDNPYNQWMYEP